MNILALISFLEINKFEVNNAIDAEKIHSKYPKLDMKPTPNDD
mgnify:CR=1 FL=1